MGLAGRRLVEQSMSLDCYVERLCNVVAEQTRALTALEHVTNLLDAHVDSGAALYREPVERGVGL